VFTGGDAHGARGLAAKLAQRGDLGVDLVEPRAYGPHESLPSRRRHNAARGAGEEADPEPLLDGTDGVAERRLGNTELRRRAGETPFPCHCEEGEQVIDVLSWHL